MFPNGLLEDSKDDDASFESSVASSFSEGFDVIPTLPPPAERILLNQWSWQYRGEGAANLVISLQDDVGNTKIARFSKSKYKDKDNNAKIEETAFYANSVMTPLLGAKYVRPVTVGIMDDLDFETVRMEAQPFRPLARCKKDIRSRKVIISPDCVFLDDKHRVNTFGDTLSIEVKPKLGHHTGFPNLCTRCLKQEAKLQEGNIESISKYCPLDLFSGDLGRMKRALFDLYENPHNRFKVFHNGHLVYTEKVGQKPQVDDILSSFFGLKNGVNVLASVLSAALLGHSQVNTDLLHLMPSKRSTSTSCDTRSKSLPNHCILDILLNLQKLALEVDDMTAEALSDKMMSELKSPEELHNLTIWYPLLVGLSESEKVLEEQLGYSRRFIEDLKKLQKFLLSVTAKDVSLLITFRPVKDPQQEMPSRPHLVLNGCQMFRVMISVIDLDPKPVHRIPIWIEKRQDWLKSYLKKN